uniref:Ketosteroid isomerase-like protein n=1 Tax=Paecilomyces divaricatus TaxID=644132 RepID=A0A3G1IHJ4_PAEDI|nr:ketosteroid isomerase-like protein [Paecilomyces divaricatus]
MVATKLFSTALVAAALVLPGSALSIIPFQKPMENPHLCDGTGIVDPDGNCNGDGVIDEPPARPPRFGNPPPHEGRDRDGFKFENPSTQCKYMSQPDLWDNFKSLEKDMSKIFTMIHKDVDFTIVGHHPGAGHYTDLLHFYTNALRRYSVCFSQYPEYFRIYPQAIHGGCNSEWSVQEILFLGRTNHGVDFDVINVWVTRWKDGQMVEVRTYIDSMRMTGLLHENELWWNSSTYEEHPNYIPGPTGLPDLDELRGLMRKPDGSRYDDM